MNEIKIKIEKKIICEKTQYISCAQNAIFATEVCYSAFLWVFGQIFQFTGN